MFCASRFALEDSWQPLNLRIACRWWAFSVGSVRIKQDHTDVGLSEDDPRRGEIIGYISDGLLPPPHDESCNLEEYDGLAAQAQAGQAAGTAVEEREFH